MFEYTDRYGVHHFLQDDVDMDDPLWREVIEWKINHPYCPYCPVNVRLNYKHRAWTEEYLPGFFEEFEAWLAKNEWFKLFIPEVEL